MGWPDSESRSLFNSTSVVDNNLLALLTGCNVCSVGPGSGSGSAIVGQPCGAGVGGATGGHNILLQLSAGEICMDMRLSCLRFVSSAPGMGSRVMSFTSLACSDGKRLDVAGLSVTPSCRSSCSMTRSVLYIRTDLRRDGSVCRTGAIRSLNIEMSRMDWRSSR